MVKVVYGLSIHYVCTAYATNAPARCKDGQCQKACSQACSRQCKKCRHPLFVLFHVLDPVQSWITITLLVCLYGTMREIRPSEPFVTEFILGKWKNITDEQLNREIYPVTTYSYLSQLVVVFLVTDFLRFKPIIVVSGFSGIAYYSLLQWSSKLRSLQLAHFFYGLYLATEVAYLTYLYAKVDPPMFPHVSSYNRISLLLGRFLGGVIAQLLIYYRLVNYTILTYITLAAQLTATIWAFWLPPVKYSVYFHQWHQPEKASKLLCAHAQLAYRKPKVLVWSGLYAVTLALFLQAQTYIQLLWRDIEMGMEKPVKLNAAVEVVQAFFGAAGAFVATIFAGPFNPAPVAALQGVALFLGTAIPNVYAAYAGFIVVGVLFQYNITLASIKVASQLTEWSCFGLIFGINTLVGIALQSLLTLILIQTYSLSIFMQYYTLSVLFLTFAGVWFVGWICYLPIKMTH